MSSIKIRKMESHLYGGPETVEHNWERKDNFQSSRVRRRHDTDSVPAHQEEDKVPAWYRMIYDPVTGEMTFEMLE